MDALDDPRLWVAAAFFLFVALAYRKIAAFVGQALDARAAKIKSELDEARRLREEAESVLAEYRRKQADYLREAESILADARRDAGHITAHAESELKSALDGRMRQALDRIAQEEDRAIADVRNHVVDIALAAARALIVDHVGKMPQEELLKLSLADIERKIH
ncbi:MAG: F0F1 ATP synthase subunit B [Pseudomonadota bacterium]|nr:F0F1 ATP synthase subunit B [Pseudomonadota bacterium]